MKLSYLDLTTTDPDVNLATEQYVFDSLPRDRAWFMLWQNDNAIIIGKHQNTFAEINEPYVREHGIRVVRRLSGGGAVYHDLGNLNFTFAASPEVYDLQRQLNVVIEALTPLGIRAQFSGRNDIIALDGRKFSCNAFKHTKTCSMQHGTLLVHVDMEKLGRYLNPPMEKMKAKGVDSVRARVCNLCEFRPDLTVDMLRESLVKSFLASYGEARLLDQKDFDIEALRARNAGWDWNYGQTPEFDLSLERRFPWGGLELMLKLKQGEVSRVKAYSDAMDAEIADRIERSLRGLPYGAGLAAALKGQPGLEDVADWLEEELPR